jgi:hypothetical protein
MTWSYSGDPTSSDLDAARLLIGDTDTDHQLLSDEELNFFVSQYSNVYHAAALAAEALAARFAPSTEQKLGDWSAAYQQRYEHFRQLAIDLRKRTARQAYPYFGGVTPLEDEDTEHVRRFKRDQQIDNSW